MSQNDHYLKIIKPNKWLKNDYTLKNDYKALVAVLLLLKPLSYFNLPFAWGG
jgi:hypothetical protein